METAVVVANYSAKPALRIIVNIMELQRFIVQWEVQRETILMTPEQTVQLINLLSKKRAEAGLSVAEVGSRAGVDGGTVWRIEQGLIASPKAESLQAIGGVLGIPSIDLFAIVGWIPSSELPSIGPYLRAKYGQLPAEALRDIEAYVEAIARRHSVNLDGNHGNSTNEGK
jgi:transcriptional regulator with XRE-family HTH domain